MLVNGILRVVPIIGPLMILLFMFLRVYDIQLARKSFPKLSWPPSNPFSEDKEGHQRPDPFQNFLPRPPPGHDSMVLSLKTDVTKTHNHIFSASTIDKTYFLIDFGGRPAINPSILPHPTLPETYIIVAQLHDPNKSKEEEYKFYEIGCNAVFTEEGQLSCLTPPIRLPYRPSANGKDKCAGDLKVVLMSVGPHDARVFYGPHGPLTVYGSNSLLTCFGMLIEDFREFVPYWPANPSAIIPFANPTELHRPEPWRPIEKNWFIFWDNQGQMYAHYDISPSRAFAQLSDDGTSGPDLAPLANPNDKLCLDRYMPPITNPDYESIHQATNSLLLTLCARSDPSCKPNESNTFIFTIFQHKSFYYYHSVYEPYIMLFRQTPPFDIHAISAKPLWINGRGFPGAGKKPAKYVELEEQGVITEEWTQTGMLYITSVSWKSQGQRYHGYIDDVMFIGFGIEDSSTGGIDVVAGDLVEGLGMCDDEDVRNPGLAR
ncbi:MAG: hypothetical protein Q9227_000014 [Pyrenula ochraceoflavens]